uniref:RecA/RadA recombinase-like protein (RAD51) n=1 Tax=uncultured marine thaumarchaeote KM3_73_B11 TaxID=1456265 RepID=A0A075HIH0_9ARCH|nr:RecA/RadA recombinase-like protein (RAD51) [uncultured marine thaumarchaeote KM3_73_B11]
MISSQIATLDKIFSGGLQNGIITEISGLRGTGKTQLALQFAIEPLKNNKKILFIDTTVEFRPERFLQMLQSRNLPTSLLDNLHISRVTNTQKQIDILKNFNDEDFSLLIIDNIADLFSFEYSKKEHIIKKNINFGNYILTISKLAFSKNIPIIITNQILSHNEKNYERMYAQLENYIHQKIQLKKIKNNYTCKVLSPFIHESKFDYKIINSGIEET